MAANSGTVRPSARSPLEAGPDSLRTGHLLALDAEAVPVAIVQRAGQLVDQAATGGIDIGTRALGRDLLLQHDAHRAPVLATTTGRRWY